MTTLTRWALGLGDAVHSVVAKHRHVVRAMAPLHALQRADQGIERAVGRARTAARRIHLVANATAQAVGTHQTQD